MYAGKDERMRQERMRRKCTKEGGCCCLLKAAVDFARGMVGGKVYDTLRSCPFSVTRGRIIVGASSGGASARGCERVRSARR